MIEPNKGLYKQTSHDKVPAGSWLEAKNVVVGRSLRDVSNEYGFLQVNLPDVTGVVIGRIVFQESVILFVDNTTEGLILEIDAAGFPNVILRSSDLNFNRLNPIRGDFIYNFQGERIITWWDGLDDTANPPRVLNIDCLPFEVDVNKVPLNSNDLSLLKLFPDIGCLDITLDAVNDGGGKFTTGAYYLTFAYVHPDNSITNYFPPSNPVFIHDDISSNLYQNIDGAEPNTSTTKSITITLDNLSTEFDTLNLAVISKIGGVLSAKVIPNIKYNTTSKTIILTNEEVNSFEVPVGSIIVPNVSYDRVHTGVFLENRLHLGNVKKVEALDYQPYANNIKAKWVRAENINLGQYEGSYKDPVFLFDKRGFASDEVYAFVTAFGLNDGTISNWFHIPGNDNLDIGITGFDAIDTIQDIENGTAGSNPRFVEALQVDSNAKHYQMFNNAKSDGTMGYWENLDEQYADEDCSDIKNAAGQIIGTLRNQNIRHHKFPSMAQLEDWGNTFYTIQPAGQNITKYVDVFAGQNDWNTSKELDGAGIIADPGNTFNSVSTSTTSEGFRIDFTTKITASININLRLNAFATGYLRAILINAAGNTLLDEEVNINGNAFSAQLDEIDKTFSNVTITAGSYLIVRGKHNSINQGISSSVVVKIDELNITAGGSTSTAMGVRFEDVNVPAEIADKVVCQYFGYIKRTSSNSTKVVMTPIDVNDNAAFVDRDFKIRNFNLSAIIPTVTTNYLKALYSIDVSGLSPVEIGYYTPSETRNVLTDFRSIESSIFEPRIYFDTNGDVKEEAEYKVITDSIFTPPGNQEFTIVDLFTYRRNVYPTLQSQEVVIMGHNPLTTTVEYLNGDTYINFQSLVHYVGDWSLVHYVLENSLNVELRHGTDTQKTFPRDAVEYNTRSNPITEETFNEWVYNTDYSSLNNLVPQSIFECNKKCTVDTHCFPYRITRSVKTSNEDGVSSWRTFKVNEYFDMEDPDKGVVYRIDKFGGSLLIHQYYSLFIAQVKDIITTNDTDLFVGRGDIFDRPPREIVISGSSNAYAGIQGLWAGLVCKHGYIFWDMLAGKVFVFKGELREISNEGLRYYLEKYSETFRATPVSEYIDNPFTSNGLCIGYDETENRILITKNDPPNFVGVSTSFTFSYSFHTQRWVSMHDYIPNAYWDNRIGEFCIVNPGPNSDNVIESKMYRMNFPQKFGIYFNENNIYPAYIDMIFFNEIDYLRFISVMWETEVYEVEDNNTKIIHDETFTHICLYNHHSCTGLIPLTYCKNMRIDNVRRTHEGWKFNDIRDRVVDINEPIILKDGIINESNLDNSKIFFKKSKFIGKFIVARFYYDNLQQKGINLTKANIRAIKSER